LADYYTSSQNWESFSQNIEMAIQLDKAAVNNSQLDNREFPQTPLSQVFINFSETKLTQ